MAGYNRFNIHQNMHQPEKQGHAKRGCLSKKDTPVKVVRPERRVKSIQERLTDCQSHSKRLERTSRHQSKTKHWKNRSRERSDADLVLCLKFKPVPECLPSDATRLLADDLSRVLNVKVKRADIEIDVPGSPPPQLSENHQNNAYRISEPWSARVFIAASSLDKSDLSRAWRKVEHAPDEYSVLKAMVDCTVTDRESLRDEDSPKSVEVSYTTIRSLTAFLPTRIDSKFEKDHQSVFSKVSTCKIIPRFRCKVAKDHLDKGVQASFEGSEDTLSDILDKRGDATFKLFSTRNGRAVSARLEDVDKQAFHMKFNNQHVDVKAPDFEALLASELERATGVSANRFVVLDVVPETSMACVLVTDDSTPKGSSGSVLPDVFEAIGAALHIGKTKKRISKRKQFPILSNLTAIGPHAVLEHEKAEHGSDARLKQELGEMRAMLGGERANGKFISRYLRCIKEKQTADVGGSTSPTAGRSSSFAAPRVSRMSLEDSSSSPHSTDTSMSASSDVSQTTDDANTDELPSTGDTSSGGSDSNSGSESVNGTSDSINRSHSVNNGSESTNGSDSSTGSDSTNGSESSSAVTSPSVGNLSMTTSTDASDYDTDSLIARSIITALPNKKSKSRALSKSESNSIGQKPTRSSDMKLMSSTRATHQKNPRTPKSHTHKSKSKRCSYSTTTNDNQGDPTAAGGGGFGAAGSRRWKSHATDSVTTPMPASFFGGPSLSPSAHQSPAASGNSSDSFSCHSSEFQGEEDDDSLDDELMAPSARPMTRPGMTPRSPGPGPGNARRRRSVFRFCRPVAPRPTARSPTSSGLALTPWVPYSREAMSRTPIATPGPSPDLYGDDESEGEEANFADRDRDFVPTPAPSPMMSPTRSAGSSVPRSIVDGGRTLEVPRSPYGTQMTFLFGTNPYARDSCTVMCNNCGVNNMERGSFYHSARSGFDLCPSCAVPYPNQPRPTPPSPCCSPMPLKRQVSSSPSCSPAPNVDDEYVNGEESNVVPEEAEETRDESSRGFSPRPSSGPSRLPSAGTLAHPSRAARPARKLACFQPRMAPQAPACRSPAQAPSCTDYGTDSGEAEYEETSSCDGAHNSVSPAVSYFSPAPDTRLATPSPTPSKTVDTERYQTAPQHGPSYSPRPGPAAVSSNRGRSAVSSESGFSGGEEFEYDDGTYFDAGAGASWRTPSVSPGARTGVTWKTPLVSLGTGPSANSAHVQQCASGITKFARRASFVALAPLAVAHQACGRMSCKTVPGAKFCERPSFQSPAAPSPGPGARYSPRDASNVTYSDEEEEDDDNGEEVSEAEAGRGREYEHGVYAGGPTPSPAAGVRGAPTLRSWGTNTTGGPMWSTNTPGGQPRSTNTPGGPTRSTNTPGGRSRSPGSPGSQLYGKYSNRSDESGQAGALNSSPSLFSASPSLSSSASSQSSPSRTLSPLKLMQRRFLCSSSVGRDVGVTLMTNCAKKKPSTAQMAKMCTPSEADFDSSNSSSESESRQHAMSDESCGDEPNKDSPRSLTTAPHCALTPLVRPASGHTQTAYQYGAVAQKDDTVTIGDDAMSVDSDVNGDSDESMSSSGTSSSDDEVATPSRTPRKRNSRAKPKGIFSLKPAAICGSARLGGWNASKRGPVCYTKTGVRCPHGHRLVGLGTDADNGWTCDARHRPEGCVNNITQFYQSDHMPRYRCAKCDYDLCHDCFERDLKTKLKKRMLATGCQTTDMLTMRDDITSAVEVLESLVQKYDVLAKDDENWKKPKSAIQSKLTKLKRDLVQ